jgi:2-polyprenyl-6-methoxyphenol hydroxylase-like FAD-dependent oxidoreductase
MPAPPIIGEMSILIIGAGICGLGTGLLLARDGHDVTILERDASPLPASPQSAWDEWARAGVAQFRQPHNFMPGLRLLLEAELPDIQDALRDAGASRFDLLHPLPAVSGSGAAADRRAVLDLHTARRPVGEFVFARAAEREPRITMRRGVRVAGLLTGPETIRGVPQVAGVRTVDGEETARGPRRRCLRTTIARRGVVDRNRGSASP